jgi:riboflavin biosynthesis pyrimidine reductase
MTRQNPSALRAREYQLAAGKAPARVGHKAIRRKSAPSHSKEKNVHRVYIDGGQLIQSFLREGLVADIVITTVPVLLGSGIPGEITPFSADLTITTAVIGGGRHYAQIQLMTSADNSIF